MKKIFLALFILLAGYLVFLASGYRIHLEHLPHYFKTQKKEGENYLITLKNGNVLNAAITEKNPEGIKVNQEGASLFFSPSEIQSMVPAPVSSNFFESWGNNLSFQFKHRPLIKKHKDKTLQSSFDNFLNEPSKIGEKILKDHPELDTKALLEAAHSAQASMQARKAQMEAEMKMMES